MRNIRRQAALAVVSLLVCATSLAGQVRCDHIIDRDTTKADARTNFRSVKPGQTVCLMAGTRARLVLENFQGAEKQPVTFVNFGGQVVLWDESKYGIVIRNSRYLRLTGSGDPNYTFGIRISGVDTGVRAGWKSSDMEFDHLEIGRITGQGILANTKSYCADGSNNTFDFDNDGRVSYDLDDVVSQSNFTQYNLNYAQIRA